MNSCPRSLCRCMKAWSTWISARSSWTSRATVPNSSTVFAVGDRQKIQIHILFLMCVFAILRELCSYGHEWAPTILAGVPERPQ